MKDFKAPNFCFCKLIPNKSTSVNNVLYLIPKLFPTLFSILLTPYIIPSLGGIRGFLPTLTCFKYKFIKKRKLYSLNRVVCYIFWLLCLIKNFWTHTSYLYLWYNIEEIYKVKLTSFVFFCFVYCFIAKHWFICVTTARNPRYVVNVET